jgi:hypothetical protein
MTPPPTAHTVLLACHPERTSRVVEGIEARIIWTERDALHFTYTVTGDIGRLRIPPLRAPRQADDLWQHTCFEAFISLKGDTAYREFNFAPSGEWTIYGFSDYRVKMPLAIDPVVPTISIKRKDSSFEMDVGVRLNSLAPRPFDARFRLGLSAVIEEADGGCSYWALKHPPGKPDFHHPDGFVLEMEPPVLEVENQSFRSER